MKEQANNTLRQKFPMKKRVDPIMYADLPAKQREVLRNWWEPQLWDLVLVDHERPDGRKVWVPAVITRIQLEANPERPLFTTASDKPKAKSECLPWMEIGQCIELLKGESKETDYGYMDDCVNGFIKYKDSCFPLFGLYWDGMGEGAELIDLLWNEVKGALEREAR